MEPSFRRHLRQWLEVSTRQLACQTTAAPRSCFRLLGAPKTVSLANSLPPRPTLNLRAIALRSPYCSANVPRTPQRTSRPYNLAQTRPIRSLEPEKSVTLPRHPFPALPHPTPHTSHLFTPSAPFLPTNPPQSSIFASSLETYAHTCYPRPREGPTPRPGNPTPKAGFTAPSTRRGVPCGRPVAVKTQLSNPTPSPCPPLPRGATFVSRKPAPALQIGAGPTTPSARRRTECRRKEQISPSREACPRGSMP